MPLIIIKHCPQCKTAYPRTVDKYYIRNELVSTDITYHECDHTGHTWEVTIVWDYDPDKQGYVRRPK